MRPEYEGQLPNRGERGKTDTEVVSVRAPRGLKAKIERYANAEGDSVSGLVIEGMLRVINDRESDPSFMAEVEASRERRIAELRAEIAALESDAQG